MSKRIYLSSPHMCGLELSYINKAFDANWIAPLGPNVDGFEQDLSNFLGENSYVAALNSGTASIHLALVILGVKAGDEVICQSLTFAATANPILYLGATPIFVDSSIKTWNIDPVYLEIAIIERLRVGKKPKAIIVVHIYGMPAEMEEIMYIAHKYNIPVIEDAAEALGSKYNGKSLGTFGTIGIISFNGNKIITTSGGGAMISNNAGIINKARFLACQAKDDAPHFQHSEIGYNYRMSNIAAGIGRGQMEVLPLRVLQRRKIFFKYKALLSRVSGLNFQQEPSEEFFSNRWLTAFMIDKRNGIDCEDFRKFLEMENIEIRHVWKPMHMQPVFMKYPFYGENISNLIFENGICLPSGSNLTDFDVNKVIRVLKKYFSIKLLNNLQTTDHYIDENDF